MKELTDLYPMKPEIINAGGSIKSLSVSAGILQHLLRWCFSSRDVAIAAQKRFNMDASFLDKHHVGVEYKMLLISDAHQDINSLLTLKVMGLFEFLVLKCRKHSGYVFQPGWLLR